MKLQSDVDRTLKDSKSFLEGAECRVHEMDENKVLKVAKTLSDPGVNIEVDQIVSKDYLKSVYYFNKILHTLHPEFFPQLHQIGLDKRGKKATVAEKIELGRNHKLIMGGGFSEEVMRRRIENISKDVRSFLKSLNIVVDDANIANFNDDGKYIEAINLFEKKDGNPSNQEFSVNVNFEKLLAEINKISDPREKEKSLVHYKKMKEHFSNFMSIPVI